MQVRQQALETVAALASSLLEQPNGAEARRSPAAAAFTGMQLQVLEALQTSRYHRIAHVRDAATSALSVLQAAGVNVRRSTSPHAARARGSAATSNATLRNATRDLGDLSGPRSWGNSGKGSAQRSSRKGPWFSQAAGVASVRSSVDEGGELVDANLQQAFGSVHSVTAAPDADAHRCAVTLPTACYSVRFDSWCDTFDSWCESAFSIGILRILVAYRLDPTILYFAGQ